MATVSMSDEARRFLANMDHENTYGVISRFAYLIGVPESIFQNEYQPPKMEVYTQLEQQKNARIIRNLCILRTSFERFYRHINQGMKFEHRSPLNMSEYVPQKSVMQLANDGIQLNMRANVMLAEHVVTLNKEINNRINNCKDIFHTWLNWDYIKDLFIMPNGTTVPGTKAAAQQYYQFRDCLPYQVYMNWPAKHEGNLLRNDRYFVKRLYEWNEDYFEDDSRVSDVSDAVKGNIYEFLDSNQKVILIADCENSDPFKLYAMLNNLDDKELAKISKIILVDDKHTSNAWQIFERHTEIPVELITVERVKEHKSGVDLSVAIKISEERYRNNTEGFLLASSDSDYWHVISQMPETNFLVLIESEKVSYALKERLEGNNIFYCYIDDFCTGNSEELKQNIVVMELNKLLAEEAAFNLFDFLDHALWQAKTTLTATERKSYYERFLRTIQMQIDAEGNVSFSTKRR